MLKILHFTIFLIILTFSSSSDDESRSIDPSSTETCENLACDIRLKTIIISGATGLIGSELTEKLREKNITVKRLTRKVINSDTDIYWDPVLFKVDLAALEGADAVIHLAGENIASGSNEGILEMIGRWSMKKKTKIMDSRVDGTRFLVESISKLKNPPRIFLSASGVSFYGHAKSSTVEHVEDDVIGTGFLADVCRGWEGEAMKYSGIGRTVILRFGVVLSSEGGIVKKLAPLFRFGGGGEYR